MDPVQKRKNRKNPTKQKEVGDLKWASTSDMEMQFGGCPASFHSYFGQVFLHCARFPPFWNGNVHTVQLYVGRILSVLSL